jgi:uncharacterized protein (DUF433 family)
MADWIVSNPEVLGGKPCIRDTRISVEFLLELLASGAGPQDILRVYPQIQPDALTAAFQYAADTLHNETTWDVKLSA